MPTTLNQQIQNLAQQIGLDIKTINSAQGDLSSLTTTQKASLVLAINELKSALSQVAESVIDDSQTLSTKTWSSNKIVSEITSKCAEVKSALLGGAGDAYDTLKELADLITENKELIDSLQELAGAHVRYDAAQELSPEQQGQARANIDAASDTEYQQTKSAVGTLANLTTTEKTNLVGAINEVKGLATTAKNTADQASTKATSVETALNTFKGDVGATDTNFVAVYTAARDGE
ncbi:MAG TPA: hypothetical protein IAC66_07610 [Candidatus Aphodousia gallistercoris]|nr:hypothetical protein [Candidatus Aphodousia gallistercoris]